MTGICRTGFAAFIVMWAIVGCSGSGGPLAPSADSSGTAQSGLTSQVQSVQPSETHHYLWFFDLIYVNPGNPANSARLGGPGNPGIPTFETIPVREAGNHWNVLKWLEQGPCANCVKITKVEPSGAGTLLVDVQIKHPFSGLNLTGFDVRGIAMFNASHAFPVSGLTLSDRSLGDGELVNADGYTTLYNSSTSGHDLEGYIKGKLATAQTPNALLNGYKRFIFDDPGNTRNAFFAGESITATYEIDMPDGPFVLGYAVDASWSMATYKPVSDPMKDFPLEANCPEAWKIEIGQTSAGSSLTECGGSTVLNIDVYDWQGKDGTHPVLVECPELFDGNVQAEWKGDSAGFTGYAATVGNPKNAQPGTYMCLVSKEAQENDPAGKPWLDLTAYQVVTLDVKAHVDQPPTAVVEASQASTYIDELIKFDGSKSHDNDCDGEAIVEWHWDWENDGVFEDEGAVVSHSWSEVGTYSVVLKVVDDEGSEAVLDPPLQIDVAELLKPPIAMADCETFPVWVTKPVHFQDMGSFDPDGGSIVKYEWDWENDGVFDEEGSDVYHTWDTPGIYYVEFRVTDDESETGVLSIPIEVEVKALAVPVAAASVYPNPGFVNQPIHFYNTDSYDPDSGDVVLYEWDWENDGVFDAVGIEAFNSWGAPGTYYVQLRVTDDDGQTGVLSQPLEVTIFESNPLNIQDLTPPSLNFSPKDLAIDGNYAYVAASGNGLHIFDITNPANPVWVNRVETGNGVIYDDTAGDDATAVAVENGYAYVADWRSGLTIVDVDPPQSATILKNVAVPGWCARAVTLYAGYAFVLCDSYPANQLVIVDVDPPEEAHVVQTVYAPGAENVVIEGGYAYTDGNAILKIDINPAEDAHVLNEIPLGGHGVAVSNGYAYTAEYHATPEYTWYTLAVIDIDPPESAYIVKELDGDHPNDLGISGNHLFLSSTWSFKAYDISSPESTQEIDSYEDQMSRFGGFDIQGENAFVANGVQGVQVLSIEPMNDISLKTTVFTPGAGRDVCVAGGYALVANYSSGLQIYDVDPPSSAAFVNAVQEFVYARRIASDDGYAFLTDMNNILAYDVDPPSSAYDANQIDVEPDRWPIAATNGYAYVGADSEGLKIIDVDPIDSAHLESTVTMNHAKGVVVDGSFAYVANGHDGLSIVDIGTVGSEYVIKTVLTSGVAGLVAVANGYAYVGDVFLYPGGPAVDVIDIDPIESAYIVKTIGLAEQPADLAVSNGYVFVADGYQGMVVVDTTVPESAYVLTECGTPWPVGSIDIVDNVAYLSGASIGDSGVLMYQLW